MKLFYKKRRFFIGTKQVHKILGSQIVQISEINADQLKTEVSEKGYNVASIIIGVFAIGAFPLSYYFSNGEFRITFKTLVFIPIILWAIYDLFIKKNLKTANEPSELVNIYTFNSFLKTIITPEKTKIKYQEVKCLRIPFIGKNSAKFKNYKYDYLTYIEFENGNTRIILGSNNFEELLEATTFLAIESKIRMTH